VQAAATADAVLAVQELDRWHLSVVAETRDDFYARVRIDERDLVQAHRAEVDALVASCTGMVFAGGHVGVLLHVLHIFNLARLIRVPLIAWSAGAMALSDRVVLFHDFAPHGEREAEMYAEGLGVFANVLPFPHARRRLRLDNPDRLRLMARRFDPRKCLLLPDGTRVDLRDNEPLPAGARWLTRAGEIRTVEANAS
jgi:cyanophycinase-like exopeptidase